MSTIVTRSGKGSPLTNTEVDSNFSNLNTDKAELSGAAFTGAITTNSTFDGRDVATDGTKLDGIEASADVTDTANVTAAGALMDSELTSIASVKALNQGVATGDSPTFVDVTATSLDISGNIDIDGTTNLDVVDIDGAVNMATTALVTGVLTTTAATVFNGGFASNALSSATVNTTTAAGSIRSNATNLLIENTNASGAAGIRLKGGSGAGVIMYGENNSTDKLHLTPRNDTSKGMTIDHVGAVVALGAVTSTGVLTANAGVVVDNFTLDGTTLALSSGDMTLDAAGRIDLSADDNGEIRFFDGSSMYGQIKDDDDRLKIQGLISNKAMLLVGNDGGSEVTMLSLDAENAGAATFSSEIRATSATINSKISIYTDSNGAEIDNNTGNFTIDTPGDIILDADGSTITFKDGGTSRFNFNLDATPDFVMYGGNASITAASLNADFTIVGNDGGNDINALSFDMGAAGNATFNGTVLASNGTASLPSLSFSGDSNTGIYRSGSDNLGFAIGGQARAFMSATQFNMTGNGIFSGNGTFGGTLGVTGAATFSSTIAATSATFTPSSGETVVLSRDSAGPYFGNSSNHGLRIITNNASRINISNSGNISTHPPAGNHFVINEDGIDSDFRVESDTKTHALFVAGDTGYVGIGLAPTHNFNLQSAGAVEARFQSTDGDCSLQISSDTDEGQDSILNFLSGTSGRGSITYDHNTTAASQAMIFKTGDNGVLGMTILGNGNVAIGNRTNPQDLLHLYDPNDDCVLNLDTEQVNKNSVIKFSDPAAQGRGFLQYAHSDDSFRIHVDGGEKTRIHSNGVLTVPAGIALGTAITANTAANVLDDYEEGTWSPTVLGGSSAGTYALEAARTGGTYTKVGNLVNIYGVLRISSITAAGSGTLCFSGFPFVLGANIAGGWAQGGGIQIAHYGAGTNSSASTYPPPFVGVAESTSVIAAQSFGKNYQVASVIGDLTADNWIYIISGSYLTT